ncbi:MAG: DMT family transporter [Oscillatoriaceae cyanobacterium Prado104]|jgi:drug/metabolite transporter (DMT)-like permease|nr:DMT family transporter [Oscillatoriaceae cyanobacterium Prado104]
MQLHSISGKWRLGFALSLLATLLWGVLPIALKIALQKLDVYTVTWFRFSVSFGLLAIYLAAKGELPELKKVRSQSWMLLAIAILFLSGNYLLFLIGLVKTSPANAQVLVQLAPVLMGLGGLVIFKERYTNRQWFGLSVMVAGFVMFFHEKLRILIGSQTHYLVGSAIVIIAAALWAVYALAQKQLLQKLPSSSIMLIIYGGCSLLFSFFARPRSLLTLNFLEWGMLIFCALNTLIAYGAFAEALEHWEASQVSAVLALTPIFTLVFVTAGSSLFPVLVSPEILTILAVAGAILVVSGSAVISLGKSR